MPFLGEIASIKNAHVKYVRRLRAHKRARYREGRYLAEGFRLVADGLALGYRPVLAFYGDRFTASPEGRELVAKLSEMPETQLWRVNDEVLAVLSDTVTPQGLVAVYEMPSPPVAPPKAEGTLLILDHVRDPGNLGTVLRTAVATGTSAALLSRGCVDAYAPKVVRSGMGAHYRLPIHPAASWETIAEWVKGRQVILADVTGDCAIWDVNWLRPSALIISSEAHGPSSEARVLADVVAYLPMRGGDSLNAAVAAAAILYEAMRQRYLFSPDD